MQSNGTGIGRALRAARLRSGKTLEEASRDTRVRSDYLDALEHESFEALGGDVYVRGFLGTYARYLGLNDGKVISVYERAYGRPAPTPAPVERAPGVGTTEAVELTERRRPNWVLATVAVLILFAAAAAAGLLSRSTAVPDPASIERPPAVPVLPEMVQVDILARETVDVEVVLDDEETERFQMEEGEARSFEADERVELTLSEGETVQLTVNGHRVRPVGVRGVRYHQTFTPESFRETSSSSAGG